VVSQRHGALCGCLRSVLAVYRHGTCLCLCSYRVPLSLCLSPKASQQSVDDIRTDHRPSLSHPLFHSFSGVWATHVGRARVSSGKSLSLRGRYFGWPISSSGPLLCMYMGGFAPRSSSVRAREEKGDKQTSSRNLRGISATTTPELGVVACRNVSHSLESLIPPSLSVCLSCHNLVQ
jgi:hypothetical protein